MHLCRSGMPLALLAEFLGHEGPDTTLIYTYADTQMKREVIQKVVGNDSVIPDNADKGMWEGNDGIVARLYNDYERIISIYKRFRSGNIERYCIFRAVYGKIGINRELE